MADHRRIRITGVLVFVAVASLAVGPSLAQAPEWSLRPDDAGNLRADAECEGPAIGETAASCAGGAAVHVPKLRVGAAESVRGVAGENEIAPWLDVRYDSDGAEFVLEASEGAGLRVAGVSLSEHDARAAALETQSAVLRERQARIQCALSERGVPGIADAIRIATVGAASWQHFAIGGEDFLAVASHFNDVGLYRQRSLVYKFSNGVFVFNQSIATIGTVALKHFVMEGEGRGSGRGDVDVEQQQEHFLAVASYLDKDSYIHDSVVYKFSNGVFVLNQSIPTIGATGVEHFVMGAEHYLVFANFFNGSSHKLGSTLHKFIRSAGEFVLIQTIPTVGARSWTHFQFAMGELDLEQPREDRDQEDQDPERHNQPQEHFLVVANYGNTTSNLQDSVIYRWSDTELKFVHNQSIPTVGAFDWEHFVLGEGASARHFLVVANSYNAGSQLQDSVVYTFSGGRFAANQSIPTIGAVDWTHFVIGPEHYLAVANFFDLTSHLQDSVIYRWSYTEFEFTPFQRIPTAGAFALQHFVIQAQHYLAVANHLDVPGGSYLQDSLVFVWNTHCFL